MKEEAEEKDWEEVELDGVMLGDARLTKRLVDLARTLAQYPERSLPQALPQWSDLKAAYRFFDNAKAVPEHILAGHIQATYSRLRASRLRAVPLVLAVQDTTSFNWGHHPATQGLGPIAEKGGGILSHGTLAVTPERLPLGLLAQQNWGREDKELESHKKRAIEDKESHKWLKSVEALSAAREAAPETTFVSVGDREADIFELFSMEGPVGIELRVRAAWNRIVESPHRYLRETLRESEQAGTFEIRVPSRSGKASRTCRLAIRPWQLTISAPRARKQLGEVRLWGILATEISPSQGEPPLEWLLLTSVPTVSFADAAERLHWYCCRWTIEVWHRVLKTGCRIESRQLENVERLRVALTLYCIIAWRILYATMPARTTPELPCTVFLATEEWQALYCHANRLAQPPQTPPSLSQGVLWIAQMGGFLARKNDGPPGPQTLWLGVKYLHHITQMSLVMRQNRGYG